MSTHETPYKETLNLPATRFEMKANLTAREPQIQARWRETDVYGQIRRACAGRGRKVLHDGPPYANGEIHMGHLLNKVLKDFVVRSLTMHGFDSPYVPGWDCHGLPIEHKVVKDLGSKAGAMSHAEIRDLCHKEAMKWVGIQRDQFRRLGVEGDWDRPYLTLDPRYEAGILDVLSDLLEQEYVFRQRKPIHWCLNDRTALAEAELEYKDETTPSIYVNFALLSGVPRAWGEGPWHAMVWTTTPWTLPANVAIAVHAELSYAGVRYVERVSGRTIHTIVAAALVEKVMGLAGAAEFTVVGRVLGRELEHAEYRHSFVDRVSPIVLAEYVSVDDGTGLVHTAPGHGTEDFQTGRAYELPTLSPVDSAGRFNQEAPDWLQGKTVFAANPVIISRLRSSGHLFHELSFVHSYPHCWRCKKPVIFRATEQWFIGVDRNGLRTHTLNAIDRVEWLPGWGKSRIDAMVSLRPDWCVSRQRSWGVPIPAFKCAGCEHLLLTAESVRHVRDVFMQYGADSWYVWETERLLPAGTACAKCGGTAFDKEFDILDVWFESGSSHRSVLDETSFGLGGSPAFMYLEGSDQHRGWFQSSILTSVGSTGHAPFETVLTHGFVVDEKGEKMSKSVGNTISAVKATEQYGADVLRLYAASMDYADDIRMSERGIKEMSEAYRKIRNTFRYILGNLEDYKEFDPNTVPLESLHEIDQWALRWLQDLVADVLKAYKGFEFYRVYQRIYQFCSVELSSFYLDVLKDRLYAELRSGSERRAAQFVLAKLHQVLTLLLAPIIPHTAEELWEFVPNDELKAPSVHVARFPSPGDLPLFVTSTVNVPSLLGLRSEILRELERLRASKIIGSAQEAAVLLGSDDEAERLTLLDCRELLELICIVSEVQVLVDRPVGATASVEFPSRWVLARKSPYAKCERCWNLRKEVGESALHPTLCARCIRVLQSANAR
jgi:isoleucyl-tRNA synthetase